MSPRAKIYFTILSILGAFLASFFLHSDVKIEQPQASKELVLDKPVVAVSEVEKVPEIFQGFESLPADAQVELVTRLMDYTQLSTDQRTYLVKQLKNKKLKPVARNNIANVLLLQTSKMQGLNKIFLEMAKDPSEDIVWRDYSVQFLAQCLIIPENRDEIINELYTLAEYGEGSLSVTAMVQMTMQEEVLNFSVPDSFSGVIADRLNDPKIDLESKVSMLALLGKRKSVDQIEIVRHYAMNARDDSLKRTAIGSLGQIGGLNDIAIINASINHPNRSVAFAAATALRTLVDRTKNFSESNPVKNEVPNGL